MVAKLIRNREREEPRSKMAPLTTKIAKYIKIKIIMRKQFASI